MPRLSLPRTLLVRTVWLSPTIHGVMESLCQLLDRYPAKGRLHRTQRALDALLRYGRRDSSAITHAHPNVGCSQCISPHGPNAAISNLGQRVEILLNRCMLAEHKDVNPRQQQVLL